VPQALPALGIVGVQDEKASLALPVEQIGSQSDLTPQVSKQVAHVQWFVDADVAVVVKLMGVQISALDEPLGQHQGWTREFCVWNWQAFTLNHRVASIAHLGSGRQAEAQLRAIITPAKDNRAFPVLRRGTCFPSEVPLRSPSRAPTFRERAGAGRLVGQTRLH
jgi:hypothetical protein